ncbi:MAG: PEP-CTERM sorting domain-containing protein [Fimbriimonas sp.]
MLAALAPSTRAQNFALGKTVTLDGTFGTFVPPHPYAHGGLADASTLTDNVFKAENHYWSFDTVWWDKGSPGSENNSILVDLGSTRSISYFVVQADDNDAYSIEDDSGFITTVPAVNTFGMVTRRLALPTPVSSRYLRVRGVGGDGNYSVSEIQAWGDSPAPPLVPPVPEPASMLALGTGVAAWLRRRAIR